jgi:uncharacterized protein YndB with AHSA1/START domain
MKPATRELLASRAQVWAFLAEPYHLSDWWPGIVSVEPDRRGFETGARWKIQVVADPLRLWIVRFPRVGRPSGPTGSQTLVITAVDPPERWAFQLFRRVANDRDRPPRPRSVEVSLRILAADRTEVAVTAVTGTTEELRLAQAAADRLYDLVQTAATL